MLELHSIWKTRDGNIAWVNDIWEADKYCTRDRASVVVCDHNCDFLYEGLWEIDGRYRHDSEHELDLVERIR